MLSCISHMCKYRIAQYVGVGLLSDICYTSGAVGINRVS